MINPIIEGIAKAIDNEFGEEYTIYTDSIEQGFDEPCFFISLINHTSKKVISNRYFCKNCFCIQYFPNNEQHRNEECYEVMDRLVPCLQLIAVGKDLTMGTKMNGEIIDGILNFFVNYNFFVCDTVQPDTMENISRKVSVKGSE